jgi:Acetyltransferases
MQFVHSTIKDLDTIFHFYDLAVEYQKQKFNKHWQGFDKELVKKEIAEYRQWKILIDNRIACIFAITFEDEYIWKEKNKDKAIYFHRIVTHPDFRGMGLVKYIVDWGKAFAKENGLDFLRMDTWGDNDRLINYYQECGFKFLGIINPDFKYLPKHYTGISLSLFEISLKNN